MTGNKEGRALVDISTFDKQAEVEKLMNHVRSYLPETDCAIIYKAYELADKAHEPQKRASGEPYILHPIAVASILAELQIDVTTIIAALLHDVVEDTEYTLEQIKDIFGDEVAFLVDGVTKLNNFQYQTKEDQQLENYRKMFLAMAKDVRVVVIKLSDRLHNMRTLKHMRSDKQKRIARETLEIFAPLAHRLGIFNIKWELEDLSFRYLEPDKYYDLVDQMQQKRKTREDIVNDTMEHLEKALLEAHIKSDVKGRPKHFYSIYKKMKKDNRDLSQIYDLYAVRVIVDTIPDCYAVLGIAHSLWKPLPYRFKDYIAMPKSNMYQSLHTTVIGTKGQPVEIQIRTWEMHHVSEHGVAAHWRYKEGNKNGDKDFDKKVGWLRQVLEWQDTSNPKELVNALKLDVFSAEVFVFTPRGDVIKLPKGSVPLDFAYRVHTDVGHRCVGAKVNGKIVSLDYKLQNGDIIDIITSKTSKPSLDWLNIVGSTESKSKIRNWFKRENREENIIKGREMLEKEAKRLNYDWKELNKSAYLEKIARGLNAGGENELVAAVGYGGATVNTVLLRLVELYKKDHAKEEKMQTKTEALLERLKSHDTKKTKTGVGVLVKGESGLLVRMAKCCNPVPGDSIVGYITRGRGVSVHRADCPNMGNTEEDISRMIEVSWSETSSESFSVSIDIEAYDRGGLLVDVMATLAELKINISNMSAKVQENKAVHVFLVVDVKDIAQLDFVMTKLRRIKDIYTVQRARGGAL